jgi:hypothetical protein
MMEGHLQTIGEGYLKIFRTMSQRCPSRLGYVGGCINNNVIVLVVIVSVLILSSCATIVNDENIPVAFRFSDGAEGHCTFKNKRGVWESAIPTLSVLIRRSDDALIYDCKTVDGREARGAVQSEIEGSKLAASVLFLDLGITDSITDKHRTYSGYVIIQVPPE